jgi:AmmeMemoRadiSam system protein B
MGLRGVILTVRRATAPGVLYPADDVELSATVDRLLDEAAPPHPQLADGVPKAMIVPHDAYSLSGPTAATAYARLRPWRHSLHTVVVLGPGGPIAPYGLTLTDVSAFETPLGRVTVDQDACARLLEQPWIEVDDEVHAVESTVEVQLPFLQRLLADGWSLVPALATGGNPQQLADALEPLWGQLGTLFVVSSDLSQGHDQRTAAHLDRRTSAAIVARWWEAVGARDVTASTGVRALLELARRHQCQVGQLDLTNSAEAGASPDHVTGYGSFIVR